MTQMDHKDLMIGDVYDVASSLVGNQPFRKSTPKQVPASAESLGMKLVNQGSPHLDWKHLQRWYEVILSVGILDKDPRVADLRGDESDKPLARTNSRKVQLLEELGSSIRGGMLDLTEQLLSSQQTAPTEPQEIRYLLILLANPLLTNPKEYSVRHSTRTRSSALPPPDAGRVRMDRQSSPQRKVQKWLWNPSKQSRCLSLILGILSNLSADCHIHLIAWFSRYPEDEFRQHVDSILSFVNDRIALRRIAPPSPRKGTKPSTYGGIPTSQMFDDVLHSNIIPILDANSDDWQLRSACKVLQLFVRANDKYHARSPSDKHSGGVSSNQRRKSPTKQLISTEHFYTSQLDSPDKFNPMDDFDAWEKKHAGFHLCQYPFLLTLGTKIKILEFDAKRKMADKARQEFFNSMFRQGTSAEKFFHLSVRRKCIIEDSLQRVSEAISSSQEEAKKALKVRFEGEEGVDAGGLRKEWFLLLVRELFDPDVGELQAAVLALEVLSNFTRRLVPIQRAIQPLLFQPSFVGVFRAVSTRGSSTRSRHLQLHHTGCALSAFLVPEACCCCTS
jgi:E3 ubiquitin-protein ligase HECTD2